jgi:hypothetical protein
MERVNEYVELHRRAAMVASEKGDARLVEWLLERLATRDEANKEVRPISSSVGRQQEADGPGSGIVVQLGVQLGGMNVSPQKTLEREKAMKALRGEVLDAETNGE